MNIVLKTALAFTVIGAINWGLIGIFSFNLVDWIFGAGSVMSRIIYVIVALAGIINIAIFFVDLNTPNVIKDKMHD